MEHKFLLHKGFYVLDEDWNSIQYSLYNSCELIYYKSSKNYFMEYGVLHPIGFGELLIKYGIDYLEYLDFVKLQKRKTIINKIIKLC